jgi:predicted enzyme related to lactoylglutathione lyase
MPEIMKAPPGTFCWVESTSKDPDAAKKFYGSIFDWSFDDTPMPGGQPYSRAMIGNRSVCGFFQMQTPAPFWLSYIAVDDADASAMKAKQLGGKVLKGPEDGGPGRYAIIEDPTGATFAVWQSRVPMGPWLYGENNALCWNELVTADTDKAAKFYTGLFGWRTEAMPMPKGPYTVFKSGAVQIGGMMLLTRDLKGAPPAWSIYFQVGKADETLARAQKSGAGELMPLTETENVGRWAMLRDTQGAPFGVLQRATRR